MYEREVADRIATKKPAAYGDAVSLVARIERLWPAAGRPDAFGAYVAQLRREHARKRNLMALFARQGW